MHQRIAKNIQALLGGANVPANRENARVLAEAHAFLDALQSGELAVGKPVPVEEKPVPQVTVE